MSLRIASFVNFLYHSPLTPPQPTERAMSRTELEAYWMPFTANRQFKSKPRLLSKASGMHYWTPDGREILDAVAGLWCVNA
jgi:beta-alanine--pyruvate transaminase